MAVFIWPMVLIILALVGGLWVWGMMRAAAHGDNQLRDVAMLPSRDDEETQHGD
jgi:hypothetical protein